ncbi:MAG: HD domain-containing phosphohydrolase [Thermodesulfovibrionales bacterium]
MDKVAFNAGHKISFIEFIRQNLRILNLTILLIVILLFFLVVKSLYAILDYIPIPSLVTILTTVAIIVAFGLFLTNKVSRIAIEKIKEYIIKLNNLLAISKDIREIVYGDLLLDKIIESSIKITGASAGWVLLADGNRLVYKIVKGIENNRLIGQSIPKSTGIGGWIMDNNMAVRIDNVTKDNRFNPEVDKIKDYDIESVLCVPLRLSTETIGVLELVNKKNGNFNIEDEELISYFADQAAISISRSQFYEDQKNFEIHLTGILLFAIENLTPGKHGHSIRVAKYCNMIANALNMSEVEKGRLHRAALFHDIGFLKLKNVSSKEEYKAHCQIAYEMLRPINFYSDIAPIIQHHHERYDGKGYPSGIQGEEIPLESRIIAIAEAFDTMVSSDSYKFTEALSDVEEIPFSERLNSAIDELRHNAGTQFDPRLIEAFINSIDEFSLESI